MTPEQTKESYARTLLDTVVVRRYTSIGTNRSKTEVTGRARVTGYSPDELVGTIMQGDRNVILYADDVVSLAPLTLNDKIVVRGRELAIIAADDSTRRVGDILIAYELQVRG